MKTNKLMLLIFLVILMSCEKSDDEKSSVLTTLKSENGLTYNESLTQWTELKNINGNSYIYQTTFVSWTGIGSTTELKIEEGIVTSRVYQEFKTNNTSGKLEIIDTYTETKTNLGSHNKGANPLTIDDLYNSCARDYLSVDKKNNTLHFETELKGLMTLCGFVPDGCVDDCFRGVRINSFKWID
ncbi:MAG: hypothetical protein H7Y10_08700 [Flavobacterium sp.]|nr:hypothetical protein [Flavobacterium sp.]